MKWLAGLFKHLGERLEQGLCDNTMSLSTDFLQGSDECDDCEDALEGAVEFVRPGGGFFVGAGIGGRLGPFVPVPAVRAC